MDPSGTKNKYVSWMAKVYVKEKPSIDQLRSYVEEFDVLLNRRKTKTKDIYQIKTFQALVDEVDEINNTGANLSTKDLENDYEVIQDDKDLLVICPYTHEASRKLGITKFAYRKCSDGKTDSAWCTTYKSADHFNSYYFKHKVTFYYVKVVSERLKQQLIREFGADQGDRLTISAIAVLSGNNMDGYDGMDGRLNASDLKKYIRIIGLDD